MSENDPTNNGTRGVSSKLRRQGRFVSGILMDQVKLETTQQGGSEAMLALTETFDGAQIEDIAIHAWFNGKNAVYRHFVKISSSTDGVVFGLNSHAVWAADASDYKIAIVSDRTKFGKYIRVEYYYLSSDGTMASAEVSMMVVVKYHLS